MKKPIKDKLILSWHFLGYKHEVLCEKLGVYLEEKKKSQTTGSGLAPWRSRPAKATNDRLKYLW